MTLLQDARGEPDRSYGMQAQDRLCATARVVAAAGGQVWLEPEQTASCGGCASAAACGGEGIGTIANRLEVRRFALADTIGLCVGDRVLVAFGEASLIKAASVTYLLPLSTSLGVASAAQAFAGHDGVTLLAALAGLLLGFGLMALISARLEIQGKLKPRIAERIPSVPRC